MKLSKHLSKGNVSKHYEKILSSVTGKHKVKIILFYVFTSQTCHFHHFGATSNLIIAQRLFKMATYLFYHHKQQGISCLRLSNDHIFVIKIKIQQYSPK